MRGTQNRVSLYQDRFYDIDLVIPFVKRFDGIKLLPPAFRVIVKQSGTFCCKPHVSVLVLLAFADDTGIFVWRDIGNRPVKGTVIVDSRRIGPDPKCLVFVDHHAMDGVMTQSSFPGDIDICRSDGKLFFIQYVQTPERSDQNGTVAIGDECAYRVVAEAGVVFVQPGKSLPLFVEKADSGFVQPQPYVSALVRQYGCYGTVDWYMLF